jgi:D-3-phosphoglycerate dehydrogenase
MKIGILEGEFLDSSLVARIREIGEVNFFEEGSVSDFLRDKDVAVVRLQHMLDENCLASASQLKFLLSATTGLNHIDADYARSRGIQIVSLKGETEFLKNVRATAEHTIGLVLALLRHYPIIFAEKDSSKMDRRLFFGSELFEKKIGLIGLGRIGILVKSYLTAFGSSLAYFDPLVQEPSLTRKASLEELVTDSEILILMASYSPENDGMVGRTLLQLMQGKYFINTARGELVDEEALLEFLESDHFKGVALDVIRNEQTSNNMARFMALKDSKPLILSPHVGGATFDSLRKAETFVFEKWLRILSGTE